MPHSTAVQLDSLLYNKAVRRDLPQYNTAVSHDDCILYGKVFFDDHENLGEFEVKLENILGGVSGAHRESFYEEKTWRRKIS